MAGKIAILDLGTGNINSVYKACKQQQPFVTNDPAELARADKIILPGVGHFKKAMEGLTSHHLLDTLNKAVLVDKKHILGICLGMQLMASGSEEGDTGGLNWFPGSRVLKFSSHPVLKVPHMGWNTISIKKESGLLKGISSDSEFYFAHSYYWQTTYSVETLTETDYILPFVSAIEKENIHGVQFHPEKSHDYGLRLIQNFCSL